MTQNTYSKVQAANGESTIPLNFLIQDKRYRFVLKVQRFEQTVQRIDTAITNQNASLKQIIALAGDSLVEYSPVSEHEELVKASAAGASLSSKDKKTIIAEAIANNPGASLSDLIKHVTADGTMTPANARYLLTKAMAK